MDIPPLPVKFQIFEVENIISGTYECMKFLQKGQVK